MSTIKLPVNSVVHKCQPMSRIEFYDKITKKLGINDRRDELGNYIIMWCPESESPNTMTFGDAIEMTKRGASIQRKGWNGKNMLVFLVVTEDVNPYFVMRNARGEFQPGWLASQEDMLASDWQIVTGESFGKSTPKN